MLPHQLPPYCTAQTHTHAHTSHTDTHACKSHTQTISTPTLTLDYFIHCRIESVSNSGKVHKSCIYLNRMRHHTKSRALALNTMNTVLSLTLPSLSHSTLSHTPLSLSHTHTSMTAPSSCPCTVSKLSRRPVRFASYRRGRGAQQRTCTYHYSAVTEAKTCSPAQGTRRK